MAPIFSVDEEHQTTVVAKRIRFHLERLGWRPRPTVLLLVLWGLFIVYATTLPFDFSNSAEQVRARLSHIREHPLRGSSKSDVISNVLLFLPWGFLLASWRAVRGTSYVAAVILALLGGASLSVLVEISQLFGPTRTPSVVDMVTNTTGSVLGALIGWPWARRIWPIVTIRLSRLLAMRPLKACSLGVAAVLVVMALAPFDVSLDMGDLKAGLKNARPIPFGPTLWGPAPSAEPWTWAGEVLTWTLVGGLFALAARESGRHGARVIGSAVMLSGGLALAMEAAQIVIPSRRVDMTSVLMALVGSTLGAVPVARSASADVRRWVTPALLVWGAAVILSSWSPRPITLPQPLRFRLEWIVPFWSYFFSRSLLDLIDVTGQALRFIPLGALLAARSWRQSLPGVVLIGLAVGIMLEVGQVFIPGRTADITDALSAAAGAGLGWVLWRWGESLPTSSQGLARYRVARGDRSKV